MAYVKHVSAAKVKKPTKNAQEQVKWDCVWFGTYPQDSAAGNHKQPIKWRVLAVKDGKALLLSDKVLNMTAQVDRTWPNKTFYKAAFSKQERKAISTSTLVYGRQELGPANCSLEREKVFLLSLEDATTPSYGFARKAETDDPARKAKVTTYARSVKVESFGYDEEDLRYVGWALRSATENGGRCFVWGGIETWADNSDSPSIFGLRPAVWVKVKSKQLRYAGTVSVAGKVGKMNGKTGWKTKAGKRFYYAEGKLVKGWRVINGHWYHFNKKGVMQTRWKTIDGNRYYFGKSGKLTKGSFKMAANQFSS